MLLYRCYFVNIVWGIEIVADWLTDCLTDCLPDWLADWLHILFLDFMVEDSGVFCPNGGKICVQDKYMSNFASDPVLCQKKPTK